MTQDPKLEPGETITTRSTSPDGTETITTTQTVMHSEAEIRAAHIAQAREVAYNIMRDALDRAINSLAVNGAAFDEHLVATLAFMPVTAAVNMALKIDGSPFQRREMSRKVLAVCMDAIRKAQYQVRPHHEALIERLCDLSPAQQDHLTNQIDANAQARAREASTQAQNLANQILASTKVKPV